MQDTKDRSITLSEQEQKSPKLSVLITENANPHKDRNMYVSFVNFTVIVLLYCKSKQNTKPKQ